MGRALRWGVCRAPNAVRSTRCCCSGRCLCARGARPPRLSPDEDCGWLLGCACRPWRCRPRAGRAASSPGQFAALRCRLFRADAVSRGPTPLLQPTA